MKPSIGLLFALLLGLALAVQLSLSACGDLIIGEKSDCRDDDDDDDADNDDDDNDNDTDNGGADPTWENFAEDFFHDYCRDCHREDPRNGAPYSLEDYEDVIAHLAAVRAETVETQGMPPSNADEFPSGDERGALGEWIDSGAPEGADD
ncbi:MAG TPA: hypothetical protein PK961_09305 [bacterium]|nr:hypothetical protein [bacterium]